MKKDIVIETSARHVHLDKTALAALFGPDHALTLKKELSQPGEFACEERVTVVGPKNEIKNVIIIGPLRGQTQVELSLTDARTVGITTPIRESGDLAGSAGCTLVGPYGSYEISEGVIAAKRHIHFTPEDAVEYGIENKEIVNVLIETDGRTLTLGDVVCRVSEKYATGMHIDTDEANACGGRVSIGTIVK